MSIPTREEFLSEVFSFGNAMESQGANYYLRTRSSPDAEATEVIAAYDAALARIAELEAALAGDAVAVVDVARWESAAKEGK